MTRIGVVVLDSTCLDYRDFVLSRIRGIPCLEAKRVKGREHDELWNTP